MSLGSAGAVSVTSAPTLIIASNNDRKGVIVYNYGSAIAYCGPDATVTTSSGLPLLPNSSLDQIGYFDGYRGSIYGVVGSGSSDCRFWEWI